ncbi:hypothetical protein B9Q13_03315 [Candidatus Marsarchaeota G2 archaeon ECH_B_SAG-G16]|jgi:hypothetical protein|uniref:Uncharacterized protein n=2 Tax=Candidatus Marsarchaeota TaxID=1978152 RepID=A0A2R6AF56_9ARCH|nr:MAG: hypothetical protein B9Q02_07995 [Candidatus Marsarchaeota G1 archaeon BE_D]PSO04914.1 MAG: hypothetical protein B9Q13_03315 [Candidatus Marsarchaeota G2 archaeon ECH_B_SAG-G16]
MQRTLHKTELVMLSLPTLFPQVYSIKKYGNDFVVSNGVSSVVVQPYYEVVQPTTQLTFPSTQFSRTVNHSVSAQWAFLNVTFFRNMSGSIQVQGWTFWYNASYSPKSGLERVTLILKPFLPLTFHCKKDQRVHFHCNKPVRYHLSRKVFLNFE